MKLVPGTIIKRPLGGLWGLFYSHMGIYVGADSVIHLNGETKGNRNAWVRKDTLAAFAAGRRVSIHAAPKNPAHGRAVRQEAERVLRDGANAFNARYDFALNNCEDFCVACYEVQYAH